MKVLDIDIDYFMTEIASFISESSVERLSEDDFGNSVWSKDEVVSFIENNLGLSKDKKIKGRIVEGHNGSLFFWKELLSKQDLTAPFEVVHVDSHADLGLGGSAWFYIVNELIRLPVDSRPNNSEYTSCSGKRLHEGIGDYLLFAVAYRWVSQITYCANPAGDKNDYVLDTLKDGKEKFIWNDPVTNTIQLSFNKKMNRPDHFSSDMYKKKYYASAIKEPEVPLVIIPQIEQVRYDGNFDYVVVAQSPNYTPKSADFIIDVMREYIEEI